MGREKKGHLDPMKSARRVEDKIVWMGDRSVDARKSCYSQRSLSFWSLYFREALDTLHHT